ncbi:MAG: hypothetical protein WC587_01025 [Candidatus Paceibacterota bacterium]
MAWSRASNFLEKFKNLKPPKKFTQDETIKIINDILGISLKDGDIEQKGMALFIKSKNPAMKSEIFLRKNKILEDLSKKLGHKAPKDIRFSN